LEGNTSEKKTKKPQKGKKRALGRENIYIIVLGQGREKGVRRAL